MTAISKWVLYITSYIPLIFIFAINSGIDLFNKIREQDSFQLWQLIKFIHFWEIIILIFVILISFVLLIIIKNNSMRSTSYYTFSNIKNSNKEISNYILMYIVPFINTNSSDLKQCIIFLLIFITIGLISVKNNSVYINPILYAMKYNVYISNNEDFIIISKYSITQLKDIGNWCSQHRTLHILASKIDNNIFII